MNTSPQIAHPVMNPLRLHQGIMMMTKTKIMIGIHLGPRPQPASRYTTPLL